MAIIVVILVVSFAWVPSQENRTQIIDTQIVLIRMCDYFTWFQVIINRLCYNVEVVYNAVSNTVNNAVGIPGNAVSNAVGILHKYVHS